MHSVKVYYGIKASRQGFIGTVKIYFIRILTFIHPLVSILRGGKEGGWTINGHFRKQGKCGRTSTDSCFLHFLSVLKCLKCFITVLIHGLGYFFCIKYDIKVMWRKTIKDAFSMFYLTNAEA